MTKGELILVPSPGKGHLIPILEFAKRLVDQDDRISVTVVSVQLSYDSFLESYIKSVKASKPDQIKFVDVPEQEEHPDVNHVKSGKDHTATLLDTHVPLLKDFLANILSSKSVADSTRVIVVVFDVLFAPAIDVAHQCNVPSYIFLTSNVGYLSLLLHLEARHGQNPNRLGFKLSDPDELIPGFINPVPPKALPSGLLENDGGYSWHIMTGEKFKTAKGVLVNTFEELESYTINALSNGGSPLVYPVGPLLDLSCKPHPQLDSAHRDKIMKWLDEQPQLSVVYLCFGTYGCFRASQVKEIALGLEQSGCRFLWSLRMPTQNDDSHSNESMLPEGFEERIQGKGMMCDWAPQVEILAHKAVGGFVSHSGWNSILESLWFGVPVVTWPLYAEQSLNAFKVVKELGLAVELRLDVGELNDEVVPADEIEKAIKEVMKEGSEVRKKVKEMAEIGRKAIENGGSSFLSIQKLIQDMIGNN